MFCCEPPSCSRALSGETSGCRHRPSGLRLSTSSASFSRSRYPQNGFADFPMGTAAVGLTLILVYPFQPRTPTGRLQLTALDVRQGDSLFLSFPDRSNLLVDGGGLLGRSFGEHFDDDSFDIGEQVVSPFLWSLGVRKLDAIALTHAHHDHMSGLHALLNNFEVGELWVGENPLTPEYVSSSQGCLASNRIHPQLRRRRSPAPSTRLSLNS